MNGWSYVKIGDVLKTTAGGTPLRSKKEYYEGGTIPWLNSGEVRQLEISSSKQFITPLGLKNSTAKVFPPETVLFALYGATAGQVGVLKFEAATNQAICGILPSDDFDAKFLCYCLRSQYERVVAQAVGNAQPNLSQKKVRELSVPMLPLPEQKRIVAILDEAFGAIAKAKENAEKNLANAKELFDSYLNRVFTEKGEGWEVRLLGDVCLIDSRLVDPKQDEFADLPHIGAGNMVSKSDQLVDVLTAREEGLISNKYTFDSTMVLYSKIRPYLMKVSRPDFVGLCSADVYPLSPNKEALERDFLFYTLLSKGFTDYAISGSARAGMPKVNRNHLFAYRLCLPPIECQRSIVEHADSLVEGTRSLESLFVQKLDALDELKQSILQKAFTGQLTSKSPELEAVP